MAQDITPSSSIADISGFLAMFVDDQPDGSQRVNAPTLLSWLSEQFSYLNGTGSTATPLTKDAEAANMVTRMQQAIDIEYWQSNSTFPKPANNVGVGATTRLHEIQERMVQEVKNLEAPYAAYKAGLAARCKSLFNSIITPGFPVGAKVNTESRVYVETFVTDWGEESQPSDASTLITVDDNDTVNVTCSAPPGGRHITLRRLYRSATGTTSSAYRLQGEYPIAQTLVVDDKPLTALNDVCATFGWLEPLSGLKGLTGMPNGMMIAYVGQTLYACEPYVPSAWPAKYDKPLARNITGIVAVGQSAFIGTTGSPYLLTGTDAASLSEELISANVPCVSGRSMVAIKNSVFYAATDGLALYENGDVTIVTDGIIDNEKWNDYNPSSMASAQYNGMYFGFFIRQDSSFGCIVFDYKDRTFAELDQYADATFSDQTGLYIVSADRFFNALPIDGVNRLGSWNSKTFRLQGKMSFGWLQVDSDFLNHGTSAPATLRFYADGTLHYTVTLSTSEPVRFKPGKFSDWRIEIDCAAIITSINMATTMEELRQIQS